jgi:hypothetical protein
MMIMKKKKKKKKKDNLNQVLKKMFQIKKKVMNK